MAITHVQQSQISGSLAWDANKTLGASLAGQSNLVGDLDALRSLVLDIKGDGDWYDAAGQDLKEVYDAMHADGANAEMQGQLNVIGALIVSGNTILGNGSGDRITFTALADSGLNMNTHKVSGLEQATAAGEALAWGQDASVSDLIVTAGDFTVDGSGNVDVGGTLGVDGLATFDSLATFYAGITVNTGSGDFNDGITANDIKIDSDAKTHLYFVGDSGEIADSADLLLVAPLSANVLAEFAHGLAPDLLTSIYLATRCPVVLAPAMNGKMYEHAATQANIKTLKARGHVWVDPVEGMLACGYEGNGKLAPVEEIISRVLSILG